MAKRKAAASTISAPSKAQIDTGVLSLLKRAAMALSRDGWNPHGHNIDEALRAASRELWPADEPSRLRVLARAHATLTERLQRATPALSVDAWEADMYRQPEDVVALLASGFWPWRATQGRSPQEETVEAYMVLQRLNDPTLSGPQLAAKARHAFPMEWVSVLATDAIAGEVVERIKGKA